MFNNALRDARRAKGLTIPEAANLLDISTSQYSRYEAGTHLPPPEKVPEMAKKLRSAELEVKYCQGCPIGRKTQPAVLNGVPMVPQSAVIWLLKEAKEMMPHIEKLQVLVANLEAGVEIPEFKAREFEKSLEQVLDFEVAAKQFRMVMQAWVDVQKVIRKQKDKCLERGYIVTHRKKEPALIGAQVY